MTNDYDPQRPGCPGPGLDDLTISLSADPEIHPDQIPDTSDPCWISMDSGDVASEAQNYAAWKEGFIAGIFAIPEFADFRDARSNLHYHQSADPGSESAGYAQERYRDHAVLASEAILKSLSPGPVDGGLTKDQSRRFLQRISRPEPTRIK